MTLSSSISPCEMCHPQLAAAGTDLDVSGDCDAIGAITDISIRYRDAEFVDACPGEESRAEIALARVRDGGRSGLKAKECA